MNLFKEPRLVFFNFANRIKADEMKNEINELDRRKYKLEKRPSYIRKIYKLT